MPFAVVGALDLLAKRAIVASFVPDERHTIVPHLLDFTFVRNVHGAMGLFGDRPLLLVALSVVVLAILWFVLRATLRASSLAQLAFGAIAGGAAGNAIDRLVHGYVVDFVAVPHFYVFNVADAAITCGLVLLAIATLAPARAVAAP